MTAVTDRPEEKRLPGSCQMQNRTSRVLHLCNRLLLAWQLQHAYTREAVQGEVRLADLKAACSAVDTAPILLYQEPCTRKPALLITTAFAKRGCR